MCILFHFAAHSTTWSIGLDFLLACRAVSCTSTFPTVTPLLARSSLAFPTPGNIPYPALPILPTPIGLAPSTPPTAGEVRSSTTISSAHPKCDATSRQKQNKLYSFWPLKRSL